VTDAIDEFEAALQPVASVDARHQAHLIVKRGVFSNHTTFQTKIAGNRQESLAPVIRLGFRGDHKLISGCLADPDSLNHFILAISAFP